MWLVLSGIAVPPDDILNPPGHGLDQGLEVGDVVHLHGPQLSDLFLDAKIRLRVDSDMLSWALMLFRGTLAFHNSIATLLVSREKWPMWPMLAASMSLQN